MSGTNPDNNQSKPHHFHVEQSTNEGLGDDSEKGALIIDINSILQSRTQNSESGVEEVFYTPEEPAPVSKPEGIPVPKTLNEKRLDSLFAVAIGGVITFAILPATNNINNPKFYEGAVTGLFSIVGWGVLYASIPYLEESKLGKISFKKKQKSSN